MKVYLLRKRHLMIGLGALLAAAIIWVVNVPSAVTASAATRQLPIYCVDRSDNLVAISFDAAWGNEDTQQLIDILAEYNVKTTFFVVGDWVDKYPESVKALHDAGHEVMNHSNTHAHYNSLSTEEIIADVNACNDKIEAITGVRPTLIRCPYGEYDDHVIAAIRSIGMEPIQWDVDTLATHGIHWSARDSGTRGAVSSTGNRSFLLPTWIQMNQTGSWNTFSLSLPGWGHRQIRAPSPRFLSGTLSNTVNAAVSSAVTLALFLISMG